MTEVQLKCVRNFGKTKIFNSWCFKGIYWIFWIRWTTWLTSE